MRAIRVEADGRMHWDEVPPPRIEDDEVRVEIHATAVNRADLLQRMGRYPPPPGAPEWMGLEMAGVVTERGPRSGARWNVGDRVAGLLAGGGYAEEVAVHPDLLLPVPAGMSLEDAASLPETFATAYLNLVLEAGLRAGERVLIHAGASGVGTAAVQIARLLGAHILATVSGEEKARRVAALGAHEVIDRTRRDVGDVLAECAASGRAVDVVLDCVGGELLGAHLGHLAVDGRWVLIATLGGPRTSLDLRAVLTRRLRLIGSTLRSRPLAVKARTLRGLEETVWPHLERGTVAPVIHARLPIEEVPEAHAILERRENVGKVVLRVR